MQDVVIFDGNRRFRDKGTDVILEYGFSNFFSFKEEAVISFRLDANCPASISKGLSYATIMGVKGANGSGKTQLLKGLSFLSHFCTDSFNLKPDELIGIESFYNSKSPTEFFIEFQEKSAVYRYEISLTETEVKRETLFRTVKKRIKLFERIGNTISERTNALEQLDTLKLRKNASIISTGNQYEIKGIQEIYSFFRQIYSNVVYSGHSDSMEMGAVAQYLSTDSSALDFVRTFISECDSGISNITISSYKDKENKDVYFPLFEHEANGIKHHLNDLAESSGTKTLFRWLPLYFIALSLGGVLIVDEMDMNLHPHILPKILQLFLDDEINRSGAQLLFATHDSEILETLGRYRTYLVAKEENESFAYRLDEIPGDILRNDRAIRPVYNSGRIGGVPRV